MALRTSTCQSGWQLSSKAGSNERGKQPGKLQAQGRLKTPTSEKDTFVLPLFPQSSVSLVQAAETPATATGIDGRVLEQEECEKRWAGGQMTGGCKNQVRNGCPASRLVYPVYLSWTAAHSCYIRATVKFAIRLMCPLLYLLAHINTQPVYITESH